MKKSHIEATALRSIMSFTVFVIIGLSSVGFYYAQGWFNKLANEVSLISAAKPTKSNIDPQSLIKLQQDINDLQTTANKASDIIASSNDYQDEITEDLNKYATDNNISISNYNFAEQTTLNAIATISDIQSNFVTITLSNPIPFTNLMHFLKEIESNSPKMQLTGININRASGSNNTVTVEPLTIEVYTR